MNVLLCTYRWIVSSVISHELAHQWFGNLGKFPSEEHPLSIASGRIANAGRYTYIDRAQLQPESLNVYGIRPF
jgi:hypothetical protein